MTFDNETIWVIGASSGIGRALAQEFDKHQARLILSARNEQALNELNAELSSRHRVLTLDIADPSSITSAVNALNADQTVLHRVVCLAGHYEPSSFKDMDIATIRQIIATNFTGTLDFVHAVLPVLIKQGTGQLALCGSVAGYRGLPNGQPYSATKAALINFAESLKIELEPFGVDVRIINPGFVRTQMTAKNGFNMPMLIDTAEAAQFIAAGLLDNRFEIRFPRLFTACMKILQWLPAALYFRIARHIGRIKS